jgi:murein DD-endopeptidase MepM/ murein hydrolase activator NlpD
MRIIVLDDRSSSSRLLTVPRAVLWVAPLILVLMLLGAAYAGFRGALSHFGELPPNLVQTWSAELANLGDRTQALGEQANRDSRAYSTRVALLQARLLRMEAVGERLAEAAQLDDGEFDFRQDPSVGGPSADMPAQSGAVAPLDESIAELDRMISDRERQLDFLEALLLHRNLTDGVTPAGMPVANGYMSSGFGMRIDPFDGVRAMHKGVDFSVSTGTPVIALASGVVTEANMSSEYGNLIELRHSGGYSTRYAHNSKLLVRAGDVVTKGQRIALAGSTGRSTGPHLHLEVLRNGTQVDPMAYVKATRRRG